MKKYKYHLGSWTSSLVHFTQDLLNSIHSYKEGKVHITSTEVKYSARYLRWITQCISYYSVRAMEGGQAINLVVMLQLMPLDLLLGCCSHIFNEMRLFARGQKSHPYVQSPSRSWEIKRAQANQLNEPKLSTLDTHATSWCIHFIVE